MLPFLRPDLLTEDLDRFSGGRSSEQTYYRWKKQYVGMGVEELRQLKILEEENRILKQSIADLNLDKQTLQDVARNKSMTMRFVLG